MSKVILVTGGLGMIGGHTARALADLGHEVVVTAHRRTEVPSLVAGRVTVAALDVTDRDAFLALGERHDIGAIVHLAGSIPDPADPLRYFRTDTAGLLNALDAARTWRVRRCAVASSLGVYIGQSEIPWHEDLPLPTADLPHLIVAFKKAVEPLATYALRGSGVQPVALRIGSIWGPLMDPESPFNPVPPYVSAVLRGDSPRPMPADVGGDWCYAPDARPGDRVADDGGDPGVRHVQRVQRPAVHPPGTHRRPAGRPPRRGRRAGVRAAGQRPGALPGHRPADRGDRLHAGVRPGRGGCPLPGLARRQPTLKGATMPDPRMAPIEPDRSPNGRW